MTYVVSDLHGCYNEYMQLKNKVLKNKDDRLIILGDVDSRGPNCAGIFLDVIEDERVEMIGGNHELMMQGALPYRFKYLSKNSEAYSQRYDMWTFCGGYETVKSMENLSEEQVRKIYQFVKSLDYYKEITVNNKDYLLIHAGISNYVEEKPLEEYLPRELVWGRSIEGPIPFLGKKRLIVGHTPTFNLTPDGKAKILYADYAIYIDCGCVFREYGGKLGCLCLDTMEEIYI